VAILGANLFDKYGHKSIVKVPKKLVFTFAENRFFYNFIKNLAILISRSPFSRAFVI
jgi:hypothetical protein